MDQTTTFSPHVYVRTLDGELYAFARSSMDHWCDLCERVKADKVDRLLAEIDADATLKPAQRRIDREDARDLIVPINFAITKCRNEPKWIVAHLTAAFVEAGGDKESAARVLAMIPATRQHQLADEIAMLPVVKANPLGTKENPILAGVEFASTGANTPSPSDGTAPASTPAE